MKIAMHELKAGLSRFVARARAGEVIEVTSHDRPVARLVGITTADEPGIARLLNRGAAQWRGGKPKPAPAVRLGTGGKPVAEMLLEDRR